MIPGPDIISVYTNRRQQDLAVYEQAHCFLDNESRRNGVKAAAQISILHPELEIFL